MAKIINNSINVPDDPNQINQINLSRLPCLPRETVLLFHWGNAVYGACPVAKAYGVKCDLPCGLWKLLHGEPISLGPNQPNKLKKPNKPAKPDRPDRRDRFIPLAL